MSSVQEEDWKLVQAVLNGEEGAGDAFALRFRDDLGGWLCSKCDATAGESRDKAIELVDQLLAECVSGDGKKGPLLEKFSGKGSLEGWLRRSARCRLISWWRSLEYRSKVTIAPNEEGDENPLETRFAATAEADSEEAIAQVLRDGLHHGFNQAEEEEPLGLVFLRLASLYGVQKQRLAQAWKRDPAQAGRRISKALDIIRTCAQDYVKSVDPFLDLQWEDYLKVFERYPRLMHGEPEDEQEAEA